jgi:signal transduction histidine kinase
MSISAVIIAVFLGSFVISDHRKSLEYNTLTKMHFILTDIVEHELYMNDEKSLKSIFRYHENYHDIEYLESLKSIDFSYHITSPKKTHTLQVIEKLPNGKFLLISSTYEYINQQISELLIELFLGLIGVLVIIIGVFYLFLKRLLYPLKCLVRYCHNSEKKQELLPVCHGSYEVNALKEAILSLQERNKHLCKEKQNIFKEAAHEIKTPIAILRARVDLYSKSYMHKEKFVQETKSDIATISNKLRELIFLKAIEWDIQQAKESVAMQNQCDMMQQLFRPILEKKQLKMVSNLQEDFNLIIHREAMGRVMQAIFENIFMHTKNGTTIETFVDAKNNTLKIVNEIGQESGEILFSSHIGTKLIERLASELEYKYVTYEKDNLFYTEITFEGQSFK